MSLNIVGVIISYFVALGLFSCALVQFGPGKSARVEASS